MYTLYARVGSGSAVVEAILAECDLAFEVVEVPRSGPAFEAFSKLNPTRKVPAIVLPDHSLMTESAAIAIYLADLHPQLGLAPLPNSSLRARYLRWILYFASDVYAANLRYYYPARHSVNADVAEGIKQQSALDLEEKLSIFADALGENPFVLGEVFSAADIYVAMLVSWAPDIKALFAKHPNIERHYGLVAVRPKITPVWERNAMLFS